MNGIKITKADIILWINIFSFIAGIIFYFKMYQLWNPAPDTVQVKLQSSLNDSLQKFQEEHLLLKEQYRVSQDSLHDVLKSHRKNIAKEQLRKKALQVQIKSIINYEWDSLSLSEKQEYVNRIFNDTNTIKP